MGRNRRRKISQSWNCVRFLRVIRDLCPNYWTLCVLPGHTIWTLNSLFGNYFVYWKGIPSWLLNTLFGNYFMYWKGIPSGLLNALFWELLCILLRRIILTPKHFVWELLCILEGHTILTPKRFVWELLCVLEGHTIWTLKRFVLGITLCTGRAYHPDS
jgi:hypothetical protein